MNITLVQNQLPQATIVISSHDEPFQRWIAEELQSYIYKISGAQLPIVSMNDPIPSSATIVLLGSPQSHPRIAELQQMGSVNFEDLKPEGFILKSIWQNQTAILMIGANDDRGVMYATYELIKRMGVCFQFTQDILPEHKPSLVLPPLDVRHEPVIRQRGFHMRHFVMPWMGYAEFCAMINQMAKLKCNYLEFYWYEGAPWIEYEFRGEKRLIGDLYSQESGYTAWKVETFAFSRDDVLVGQEHFLHRRPCAAEFQTCQTPEEAHQVAKQLLRRMIQYAHSRKIEVWLGAGDCPTVPPNLGRNIQQAKSAGPFGYVISPGDPAGVEIWTSILESMVDTYPEADGYWLWLAESYFEMGDEKSAQVLKQYSHIETILPNKAELLAMGYDQYVVDLNETAMRQGDLGLVHYGTTLVEQLQQSRPHAKLGLSLLGRSYLFRAFDALLPQSIRLQSMESAVCWNRCSRIPMENFGGYGDREMFLVPRLDDDENEFALQFNVGLYHHDRVLAMSQQMGVSGVVPQIGKTRGAEHNAKYIADGCWNPGQSVDEFYHHYAERTFGQRAKQTMSTAMRLLDAQELSLGLYVNAQEAGHICFQGMGNFFNYADSRDIGWLKWYRQQRDPATGLDWLSMKGSEQQVQAHFRGLSYRHDQFTHSIIRLQHIVELLLHARSEVRKGACHELEFLIVKTEAYILHLHTCCSLMEGILKLEAGYEAKRKGEHDLMMQRFADSQFAFAQAYASATETAAKSASFIDHPSEKHILFRYNVRQLLPIREFQTFIANVVNFHQGQLYWRPVRWEWIDP